MKIASPEATNEELLEAASGLPMLVSTGALDWRGCDRVNGILLVLHAEFVLLHCVSAYPADPREMNLCVLRVMQERYRRMSVGLSDHTEDHSSIPSLAVAAGACVIEKHLTLDSFAVGPDHSFALEPSEFGLMVADIRETEQILGDGVKRVQPSEDATDRRVA